MKLIGDAIRVEDIIKEVVGALPAEIREWTDENLWFVGFDANAAAVTFVAPIRRSKVDQLREFRLVCLGPWFFDHDTGVQRYILAHEIAHHWRRHPPYSLGHAWNLTREQEADSTAVSWGFTDPRKAGHSGRPLQPEFGTASTVPGGEGPPLLQQLQSSDSRWAAVRQRVRAAGISYPRRQSVAGERYGGANVAMASQVRAAERNG